MKRRAPAGKTKKAALRRPHFDLAPALRVPARTLVRDENDAVGRLIVRLAAGFNDVKSTHLALEKLSGVLEPLATETDRGEKSGLVVHAFRLCGAVMYEVLEVLRNESKTLAMTEVVEAHARLGAHARGAWDELVAQAKAPESPGKAHLLWFVRNKSASHYDRDLAAGFLRGFEELGASRGQPAYSDGDTMERTRFYFADVAMRAVVAAKTGQKIEDIEQVVMQLSSRANYALKPMIVELIRGRTAAMNAPKEEPADGPP